MQTSELTTTIEPDGIIRLPEKYKTLFGKQIKLIILIPDENEETNE